MNEFKNGYHPRSNSEEDENGSLFADYHRILNGWKETPFSY
jgi:hypothetical protein